MREAADGPLELCSKRSHSKQLYFTCISRTLRAALCILPFPGDSVETDAPPAVEQVARGHAEDCLASCSHRIALPEGQGLRTSPLRLAPLCIRHSEAEYCYIEPTLNSTRVSFRFARHDDDDDGLQPLFMAQYLRMLTREGLRRLPFANSTPANGFDISFLVGATAIYEIGCDAVLRCLLELVEQIEGAIAIERLRCLERTNAAAERYLARHLLH